MSKKRVFRRRPGEKAAPLPRIEEPPAPESAPEAKPEPVPTPVAATPPPAEPVFDTSALEDLASMSMEDFAAAMEGVGGKPRRQRLSPGDQVEGLVVRVGKNDLFIDLGGKSEATMAREEAPEARVGDGITAFVLRTGEELRLCKKLSGRQAIEGLEAAVESGIPMDGRVTERNTGGFVVEIGKVRAFCPVSQIDHRARPDLDSYVGEVFAFQVKEIRGRDVVVSRRELAAEESKARVEALWAGLHAGQILEGSVASIQDYGAFIDLGGVQGLAHKSELSWDRRARPADLVKAGQVLTVRVLSVDRAAKKISLGLKDKLGEPGQDEAAPRSGRLLPEGGMGTFAAAFAKAKKD